MSGASYMLVVVLAISLAPLFFDVGRSADAPFLFSASWRLGVAVGCLAFLIIFHWSLVRNSEVRSFIFRRVFRWGILFAVLGNCEYLLFAWSTKFTDISVVTIVYEIWPIFLILLMARLYRGDERYGEFKLASLPLLLLPFAGLILVVLSQTGGVLTDSGFDVSSTVAGVLLALGAALLAPLMAFGFKWGSELSIDLSEIVRDIPSDGDAPSLDMFCAIVAFFISSLAASFLTFIIGMSREEPASGGMFLIAVIGGVAANAVGGIAWRKAHFETDNLGIHAIAYGVPIVSLLWLGAFSRAGGLLWDYFTIGAIAIISSNVLINLQAEIRSGFKTLILALGISGAVVYFRETLFRWGGVENWFWAATEYVEAIALSATVFILLLAFRVTRSKQSGIVLGELFALGLFAVIVISLTLFSKPPGIEGWTGFLVDMFSILLSSRCRLSGSQCP